MTMNRRERMLLRATGAVVVLSAVYFLLVDPALTRWEILADREAKAVEKDRSLRMRMGRRPALKDEIHEMEERITSSAPETMESDFHVYLKAVAEQSKVTPSSVSMVKRQPLRDGFEEIVLSVNLDCDTPRLTDYLFHLEKKSDRLVKISRLDVSRGVKRKREEGELGVTMILSTVVKSKAPEGASEGGADEKR